MKAKPTSLSQCASSFRPLMESLEHREMFTATFTLNDCSFSSTQASANVVAPGFKLAWWTDTSAFSNPDGTFDDSKTRIAKIAKIAENGGTAPWTGKAIPARTPTILDFGGDLGHDLNFYTTRLKWFHQSAPHVKVAMIGIQWGVYNFTRDVVANPTTQQQATIDSALSAGASFVGQMDFLPLYAYMLGPTYVDRDLKFIQLASADFKKAFPGKIIPTWTWGAYHTAWNPPGSVLSDT